MSVLVESYSWIIRSNLSQQKHLLSKITLDKHPVQLNFKIVQHQGNHPFPGKIILMVDCILKNFPLIQLLCPWELTGRITSCLFTWLIVEREPPFSLWAPLNTWMVLKLPLNLFSRLYKLSSFSLSLYSRFPEPLTGFGWKTGWSC